MKKITIYSLVLGALLCWYSPLRAEDHKSSLVPILSLLLAKNDTCFSVDPITINSIQAERAVPFAPVTLQIDGINSLTPGVSTVSFDDLKVRIDKIDYLAGTVTVLLPNKPGTVDISLQSECAPTLNSTSITIGQLSLPSGKTVDDILTDAQTSINLFITKAQTQTSNTSLTPDQISAFTQVVSELTVLKDIINYFSSNILTDAERLEFAAFLANSGYLYDTAALATMSSNLLTTPMAVGSDWISIDSARTVLKTNGWISDITDFNAATSLLANVTPGVNVIMRVIALFQKICAVVDLYPSLLQELRVTTTLPVEGFYRDAGYATVVCKGDFAAPSSVTEKAINAILDQLVSKIIQLPGAKRTEFDQWLTNNAVWDKDNVFDDDLFQGLVKDSVDVDDYKNKIWSLIRKAEGDPTKLTKADVEFPCDAFQYAKRFKGRGRVSVFSWSQKVSLEPIAPGDIEATILLSDDLKKEDFTVETKFALKVLNHLPYIVLTPTCSIKDTGACSFTLSGLDEDWDDKDILFVKNATATHGTVSGTLADGFTYQYDQKPLAEPVSKYVEPDMTTAFALKASASAESDTITLQLCDPYDCVPINVPVDFTGYNQGTGAFTYHIVGTPQFGIIEHVADQWYRYTPKAGIDQGIDKLSYYVTLNGVASAPASLTISIINESCEYVLSYNVFKKSCSSINSDGDTVSRNLSWYGPSYVAGSCLRPQMNEEIMLRDKNGLPVHREYLARTDPGNGYCTSYHGVRRYIDEDNYDTYELGGGIYCNDTTDRMDQVMTTYSTIVDSETTYWLSVSYPLDANGQTYPIPEADACVYRNQRAPGYLITEGVGCHAWWDHYDENGNWVECEE